MDLLFTIDGYNATAQSDDRLIIVGDEDQTFAVIYLPGFPTLVWLPLKGGKGGRWHYNGNPKSPTLRPDIISQSIRGDTSTLILSHVMITDGVIVYQDDCTNDMGGKMCELPRLETWLPKLRPWEVNNGHN